MLCKLNYKIIVKFYRIRRGSYKNCAVFLHNFEIPIIIIIIFWSNATTCPCGLRGPPSWAWQQCNRLLSLGRP